ncbi:uncharacterized protein LOC141585910 [Silene latifolia]|uniref:uncharacterized protein LOC141585910 n=1 Tax=Silene latifolia TaxID=37657 RepID=UPI003D77F68A
MAPSAVTVSLSAPLVQIYGNELTVTGRWANAKRNGNGNLYMEYTNVVNLDVRGKIDVGFLKSNKTYIGVFEVAGECTDIKIEVYDPKQKEMKNASKTYSNNANITSLASDSFQKPRDNGQLMFRLVQRGNKAIGRMIIKRLILQEEIIK